MLGKCLHTCVGRQRFISCTCKHWLSHVSWLLTNSYTLSVTQQYYYYEMLYTLSFLCHKRSQFTAVCFRCAWQVIQHHIFTAFSWLIDVNIATFLSFYNTVVRKFPVFMHAFMNKQRVKLFQLLQEIISVWLLIWFSYLWRMPSF